MRWPTETDAKPSSQPARAGALSGMARLCLLLLSALLLTARAAAGEQAVLVADYLCETGPRDLPGYETFQATFWGDASVLLVACRGPRETDCAKRLTRTDPARLAASGAAVRAAGLDARPALPMRGPARHGPVRSGYAIDAVGDGRLPRFVSAAEAARIAPVFDAMRAAVPIGPYRRVNRDADRLARKRK